MVSILSQICNTLSHFSKLLGIVPRTQNTIGINVTFMFHSFLALWQGPNIRRPFCFLLISLCILLERQNQSNGKSGLLTRIKSSVSIWKSQWILYVLFSWMDSGLCLYMTYACDFVAYFQFLLLYNFSSWHCFVLLFKEIQFLSWYFHFLKNIFRSSRI